ncbi:MAG: DEAD/DEAH box helicase [Deltaproteobacteria bacterium]|nr:DEAD/DEAH box helicase [Deltaproteobacteria bacterium]
MPVPNQIAESSPTVPQAFLPARPPEEGELKPITLSPQAFLIFPGHQGDWRERLFELSAVREQVIEPSHRFWRTLADELLSNICRLPEGASLQTSLVPPPPDRLAALVDGAPPMPGAEYLSSFSLVVIWGHLAQWLAGASRPSLAEFMAKRAPKWRRVGRVTFHLAENKLDPLRPFAFMATFVNSLTSEGRDRHQALGQALKEYAGEGNHPGLLNLLLPVKNASERLPWVAALADSKEIYRPLAWTIDMAHQFLKDIPVLEDSGLTVRIPDWWRKRPQARLNVQIGTDETKFDRTSLMDWDVSMAVGDHILTPEEIEELLATNESLVFFKGQWLEVDSARLKEALDHWNTAKAQSGGEGLPFIQAMRLLAGLPASDNAKDDLPDPSPWVVTTPGPALERLLGSLRNPMESEPPETLNAVLRPYQKEGLAWLSLLSGLGLGACLADDMGLGKTIQVLALLLLIKKKDPWVAPSLLVVPASLMANWRSEAARFAPSLRLATWHPSESSKATLLKWEADPEAVAKKFDLVITSYALVGRNVEAFLKFGWNMVIVDEAQAIKNPSTAQSRAVKRLHSQVRLALTGTPIENRLVDLWSLFDFLNPGLMGSLTSFQRVVSRLESSEDQYAPIRRLVAPYLLRRLKSDSKIINDLPDKVETTLHCFLTPGQAKLYGSLVKNLENGFSELKNEGSADSASIMRNGLVLKCLTQLKQLINHPAQLLGDNDWDPKRSGKFMRLSEICREMAERQERVLVFTQYKEIIPALADHLATIFEAPGLILHGSTKVSERERLVAQFQADDGPPFFVLSLRAAGVGLNLTAAGQVIHFDRWWNPAVEDQATDRAYRIGQKKNVMVHKCVTRGTLEERIDNLLKDKRELAADILSTNQEFSLVKMDNQAILKLISLDIEKAVL